MHREVRNLPGHPERALIVGAPRRGGLWELEQPSWQDYSLGTEGAPNPYEPRRVDDFYGEHQEEGFGADEVEPTPPVPTPAPPPSQFQQLINRFRSVGVAQLFFLSLGIVGLYYVEKSKSRSDLSL